MLLTSKCRKFFLFSVLQKFFLSSFLPSFLSFFLSFSPISSSSCCVSYWVVGLLLTYKRKVCKTFKMEERPLVLVLVKQAINAVRYCNWIYATEMRASICLEDFFLPNSTLFMWTNNTKLSIKSRLNKNYKICQSKTPALTLCLCIWISFVVLCCPWHAMPIGFILFLLYFKECKLG